MIWLLLFAVYPGALDIAAPAGGTATAELLLVGDEPVRISAAGVIAADELVELDGKRHLRIPLRIDPKAAAGTHEAFLYVSPDTDDPVSPASAVRITTEVAGEAPARLIETGARKAWERPGVLIAGAMALLGVVALLAIRIER